jgi:DUF971 family protein
MAPDGAIHPQKVDIEPEETLIVSWEDGHVSRFATVELRRACPCAQCSELRRQGLSVWPRSGAPPILRAENAELIGAWGISLFWNDGHETGIYAWDVLRSWCPCGQCTPAPE